MHEQVSAYNHIVVRRTTQQLLLCYRHPHSQIEETESRLDPDDPLVLPSAYTQAMLLSLIWQPHPRRILLIGLGGGRLQMVLHHYLELATNLHSGIPGYAAARTTFETAWPHTAVFPVFGGNVVAVGGELATLAAPAFSARLGLVEQHFLGHLSLTRLAHGRDSRAVKTGRILHDTDQP